jgi:excisionase family DNA binding protein
MPSRPRDPSTAAVDPTPAPVLLTVPEVAQLLRVPPKSVYQLAALRRIPVVRLGRSLRFDRADVVALIQRNRVPSLEK